MYRIFCVEDDETIGKMIKKHLEKWDFEVHVAEDLSQIMTEFAAFDPQLVLLDIRLPFFNGYHWCSQIRSISNSGIDGILPAVNYSRNPSVLCFSVDYKAFEALFHA